MYITYLLTFSGNFSAQIEVWFLPSSPLITPSTFLCLILVKRSFENQLRVKGSPIAGFRAAPLQPTSILVHLKSQLLPVVFRTFSLGVEVRIEDYLFCAI